MPPDGLGRRPADYRGAEPLGLHLEGPMLSAKRPGIHDPALMRPPSLDLIKDWSKAGGVAMVTMAPELAGSQAVIEALIGSGVVVAAGHTAATMAEAEEGFEWGIKAVTHIFNAMEPFDHRAPGLIGAVVRHPTATAGIIADGLHSDPGGGARRLEVARAQTTALVTDAMAATGLGDGDFNLGSLEVNVKQGQATDSNGRLAGSTLTLDQAVRNLVDFAGCSWADAWAAASSVPAHLLGLDDRGRMAVGNRADLVLLDDSMQVAATMVGGRLLLRQGGLGPMTLWAEIESQPEVLGRLAMSQIEPATAIADWMSAEKFSYVVMAARGSSDNAARYAQYLWGARNRLNVALAAPSLYGPYQSPPDLADSLVVGISQSGESPDLLAVLAEANRQHRPTLAITNQVDSPMARLADRHLDLAAGPEMAVAATKSYTTQLLAIGSLSAALSGDTGMAEALSLVAPAVSQVLEGAEAMRPAANTLSNKDRCVVIGRGFHHSTASRVGPQDRRAFVSRGAAILGSGLPAWSPCHGRAGFAGPGCGYRRSPLRRCIRSARAGERSRSRGDRDFGSQRLPGRPSDRVATGSAGVVDADPGDRGRPDLHLSPDAGQRGRP